MIAVTGATGKVGGALVAELSSVGEQVIAISRRTSAANRPKVEQRVADLTEPDTLRTAAAGADSACLIVAGTQPRAIVDALADAGVQRVVLLSSLGLGIHPEFWAQIGLFEDAVQTSSLGWTLLRPGGFDSNAMAWAQSIRTDGVVRSPYGDAGLPTIDPADIAAVAAAILRSSDHDGEIYDLTGPSLISPRAQTAVLAEVLGRPLEFIEQTAAEAKAQMLELISEPIATGTLTVQAEAAVTPPPISPHVERILGRRGRTFAEWAIANAAAFG